MKNITQIFLMILVLTVCTFAQLTVDVPPNPASNGPEMTLSGQESNRGQFAKGPNMTIGNSFVLNGSTDTYSSTVMTVAFDYNGEPALVGMNVIVGGTWNMAFYTDEGGYRGSIFGTVNEGRVDWPEEGADMKSTFAQLIVTGGSGDFEGTASEGTGVHFEAHTRLRDSTTDSVITGLDN